MSRRNKLYTKQIDYTAVEEYLDSLFAEDPMPLAATTAFKKVRSRFQVKREYTVKSIQDAVSIYYDEHFGGTSRVRNMLVSMSNNCRTVSEATRKKMSQSQMHNKNRLGKKFL